MAQACAAAGHDVAVIDHTQQRCRTCCRTYLVDSYRVGAVVTDADRAELVDRVAGPGVCRTHPGELAHSCRCCRADRLAGNTEARPRVDQLDAELIDRNARGVAAVRAALRSRGVTT